ncbi:phosphatidylinositol-glycan biosynthesis class X protein [Gastrophryne carolinensis]
MSKLMAALLPIILIVGGSVASTDTLNSCLEVKVEREILKSGFHRDLETRVSVRGFTEQQDSCRILLNETIPSGLFMDPYQLSSLQQHDLVEVILSESVDVEAPEYLSTKHNALVYMKLEQTCNHCYISAIPVHARYHRPSSDAYEVSVQIQNPQLLIHCEKEFPPKGCSSHPLIKAPCGSIGEEECQWLEVPYTLVKDNTVMQVPVGIMQHGPLVYIATIVVTLGCTGMLIMSIYWHKQKYD